MSLALQLSSNADSVFSATCRRVYQVTCVEISRGVCVGDLIDLSFGLHAALQAVSLRLLHVGYVGVMSLLYTD